MDGLPHSTESNFKLNVWPTTRLMVVGAVAGVVLCLGLLIFPAIAMMRNSEMRVRSENNMKQIALGVHSYHDANNGRFPSICDHGSGGTWKCGAASLYYQILPYVEGS